MDVSIVAASRTASFRVPAWRIPSDCCNHWFFKETCTKLKFWNPGGCVDFCHLRDGHNLGPRICATLCCNNFEPSRAEPHQAAPSWAEPSRAERHRAAPRRANPSRAERSRTDEPALYTLTPDRPPLAAYYYNQVISGSGRLG